jgi:hypothetical protein
LKVAKGELTLNPQLVAEIENAREKLYLREIVGRYERVVERAGLLEVLPFRDDQLSEADLPGVFRTS